MAKREFVPRGTRKRVPLTEDERKLRDAARIDRIIPDKSRPFETRYTMNKDAKVETSGSYGPFTRVVDTKFPGGSNLRSFWCTRTWYRSKTKRHKRPNPFTMITAKCTYNSPNYTPDVPNSWYGQAASGGNPQLDAIANNTARSRWIGKVRDSQAASLAVTLAEWQQSERMIVTRAGQLLSGIRAAKRGDVKGLEKALGIKRKQRNRRASARDASGLWLEYHFGWEPLIGDIHNAVKVLASNPPAQTVRATGRYHYKAKEGSLTNYTWWRDVNYLTRTLIQGDVFVSNPNLALANQLGLVNPATVAWELVPFSFVVDWFIPVGKFLDSFSDLLGYRVDYAFSTLTRVCSATSIYSQPSAPYIDTGEGFGMFRTLGIPAFKLRAPPFKGFSPARGATAIALVIQQFLSIGKLRG